MSDAIDDMFTPVFDYAQTPKKESFRKKWLKGSALGLSYGAVWPATICAYLTGGSKIYDTFLPHNSLQDQFVFYAFRIPSEFVARRAIPLLENTSDLVQFSSYLTTWALIGLTAQRGIRKLIK